MRDFAIELKQRPGELARVASILAQRQVTLRAGTAIAMVEQNAREALTIAHRAYILVDGRNHRDGAAAALASDPDIRRIFLGG